MAARSRHVLRAEGASPADTVSTRTFVTDLSRLAEYGAVRAEFFPAPPTSVTVEVSALFRPGAVIEVEAVAAVPAASTGR